MSELGSTSGSDEIYVRPPTSLRPRGHFCSLEVQDAVSMTLRPVLTAPPFPSPYCREDRSYHDDPCLVGTPSPLFDTIEAKSRRSRYFFLLASFQTSFPKYPESCRCHHGNAFVRCSSQRKSLVSCLVLFYSKPLPFRSLVSFLPTPVSRTSRSVTSSSLGVLH